MKVFRLVFYMLILVSLADTAHTKAPWGILKEVPEETTFSVYAIDNLIDRRPIRYAVSESVTPEEEEIFKANIHKWPAETLRFINDYHAKTHTQVFQDIVPILEYKLVLVKVSLEDSPDIVLRFSDKLSFEVNGDFRAKKKDFPFSEIRINEKSRDKFASTTLHEVGHYFGLGDQYGSARLNSHAEYSSDVDTRNGAVMNEALELTYDDADGFINLLDLRLSQRNGGQFSARAHRGKRSVDPASKNFYQDAKTSNRKPVDSITEKYGGVKTVYQRIYKRGTLQYQAESTINYTSMAIFAVPKEARVKRDPKTHLIRAIYTNCTQKLTLPDGKTSQKDVVYEKHFTYGSPILRENEKIIPLSVQEIVDKQEINRQELTITSTGRLTGLEGVFLDSNEYWGHALGKTIVFRASNGFQHSSAVHYSVEDSATRTRLAGYTGEDTATFTQNGHEQIISVPPDNESDAFLDWGFVQYYWEDIRSFYQNFYEPLFDTSAQDMQTQVKQAMGMRR